MRVGRLLLRLSVGCFFFGHGAQKLFGWFGGRGLDATAESFETLGLRPGRASAVVAGAAEAGGGALLAAGIATPFAATILTSTMLTAIHRVHLKNGPWASKGGYEYNVVLIAALLALVESEGSGRGRAGKVLAAGAVGALGAHALAERFPSAAASPTVGDEPPAAQRAGDEPAAD
jgi:putative oxidoreductase